MNQPLLSFCSRICDIERYLEILENASEILYYLSVAKFPNIDTDNLFSLFFYYSDFLHTYWWIDSVYSLLKPLIHLCIFFLWEFGSSVPHNSLILLLTQNFKICIILKFVFGCPWTIFLWLFSWETFFPPQMTSHSIFLSVSLKWLNYEYFPMNSRKIIMHKILFLSFTRMMYLVKEI